MMRSTREDKPMAKETIFIELIALEDAFGAVYAAGIRRIIHAHSSRLFHFCVWDPLDAVQPSAPDVSLVAVEDASNWTAVRKRVHLCHSSNIGLLGTPQPLLGLPVVNQLSDLSALVGLRRAHATVPAPLWDTQNHLDTAPTWELPNIAGQAP